MTGVEMMSLLEELYPITRSITGDGVRETLAILSRHVPIEVHEVPSGSPALDWTVPLEWNVREAWIRDAEGKTVVDFRNHNLHLVGYSVPVRTRLSRQELDLHLYSMPDRPDWIPWRTSLYDENWGFCLPHSQREALPEGEYEVCIDSRLEAGHLTYGELFLPGKTDRELLVSVHTCHPSLANDNLSGICVAVAVAQRLAETDRRAGIRFVFAPGTIGALTWLERNRERTARIAGGMTLTCLGNDGPLTYKRSYDGHHQIDHVASHVLTARTQTHAEIDFHPFGYDERQYNSPAFRMPIGSLMRGRHGQFAEYHTSADDPSFVAGERLEESAEIVCEILTTMDRARLFRSLQPEGEPQLGRRGLYRAIGGDGDPESRQIAMLWLLQMGDGTRSLLEVAQRSELDLDEVVTVAELLVEHELLEWC
jgi:aminopeptidase-like protein